MGWQVCSWQSGAVGFSGSLCISGGTWRAKSPQSTSYAQTGPCKLSLQGTDPGTDFRGAGLLALECLLFLAQRQPAQFDRLRHKRNGTRSQWEYPFAVAGVNLTFMLLGAPLVHQPQSKRLTWPLLKAACRPAPIRHALHLSFQMHRCVVCRPTWPPQDQFEPPLPVFGSWCAVTCRGTGPAGCQQAAEDARRPAVPAAAGEQAA
jgi:ELMO/CED-12 family